jgi:hypothetical protein
MLGAKSIDRVTDHERRVPGLEWVAEVRLLALLIWLLAFEEILLELWRVLAHGEEIELPVAVVLWCYRGDIATVRWTVLR